VEGTVVHAKVEKVWTRRTIVDFILDPVDTLGSRKHYAPLVEFRYRVSNDEYVTGDFWYPTESRSGPEWAAQLVKPWRRGRVVRVRYDPRDPRRAVVLLHTRTDMIARAAAVAAASAALCLYLCIPPNDAGTWPLAGLISVVNVQSIRAINLATSGTVRGAYWYQRKL
jgi:hypothetical protein